MQSLFFSCLGQADSEQLQTSVSSIQIKLPEPYKLKFFKALNLYQPILRKFAFPHRKQAYTFARKKLRILQTQKSSVPFVYSGVAKPHNSILLIYSHGSGSTLNHVFEFIMGLSWKFNISTIAYDYTGDGESTKQFHSYQEDLKIVLSWAINQGYSLSNIILCGFSIGSYSALCIKGPMPRILISPICGLTAYIEDNPARYQGQIYDNIEKAMNLKTCVLITHCTKQMIPIQHSKLIYEALLTNNLKQNIQLVQIKYGFQHKTAPGFLFSQEGSQKMDSFIEKISLSRKGKRNNSQDNKLKEELQQIYQTININQCQFQE